MQFTICIFLFLLMGCAERQVRIHFENAARHRAHGQIDSAMAEYHAILKLDPNAADAHNALGVLLAETGDYDPAIVEYRRALANSDKADIHFNLGVAFSALGMADSAIAAYERALDRDPKNSEIHNGLGVVHAMTGRTNAALKSYQNAIKYNPQNAEAHNNLGLLSAMRGQFQQAIGHYQKAVQIRADFAEAHNNLGSAYAEQGQFDRAIAQFQKALSVQPDNRLARDNLQRAKEAKQRREVGEMRARHILVPTEAEARDVLQKLKAGASFEALARLHSRGPSAPYGGDIGAFLPGTLLPEFERAVREIAPGEIGGPVKTAAGYHIIKRLY